MADKNGFGIGEYLEKINGNTDDDGKVASVAVVSVSVKDRFFSLLSLLCAVEMLAKDFHYRAKGKAFYGEHLLADLVADIGESSDDVNEVRYMGELGIDPPLRSKVAKEAAHFVDGVLVGEGVENIVKALSNATDAVVRLIENIKDSPVQIASGTVAVLDAISQKALQSSGFLNRMIGDCEFESDDGEIVQDESLI